MRKILFVSHCILNTAAKAASVRGIRKQEEKSRQEFVMKAAEQGNPTCSAALSEFTLYGPKRWGPYKGTV